jgi:hypothetical protein
VWRFGQVMTLAVGDAQIEQLAHGNLRPSRARNVGTLGNCFEVTLLKSKLCARTGLLRNAAKN